MFRKLLKNISEKIKKIISLPDLESGDYNYRKNKLSS